MNKSMENADTTGTRDRCQTQTQSPLLRLTHAWGLTCVHVRTYPSFLSTLATPSAGEFLDVSHHPYMLLKTQLLKK